MALSKEELDKLMAEVQAIPSNPYAEKQPDSTANSGETKVPKAETYDRIRGANEATKGRPTAERLKAVLAAGSSLQNQPDDNGLMIGMGEGLVRLGQGAKQLMLQQGAPSSMPPEVRDRVAADNAQELQALQQRVAEEKRLMEPLYEQQPVATTAGRIAPAIGAGLIAPQSIPAQMAIQGGLNAMEYGTPEERLKGAAWGAGGAGVGGLVGKGVNKLMRPTATPPSAGMQESLQAAERIGVQPPLSVARGQAGMPDRTLAQVEGALRNLPGSAGLADDFLANNQRAVNRAYASELGQSGDEVSDAILAAARDDLRKTYTKLKTDPATGGYRELPLNYGPNAGLPAELMAIKQSKAMDGLRNTKAEQLIDDLHSSITRTGPGGTKIKTTADADWWQQNKTLLDDAIRDAQRADQTGAAKAMTQLRTALDRAFRRTLPAEDQKLLDLTRKRYAILEMAETGQVRQGANINPTAVNNALAKRYESKYLEGGMSGPTVDIGRMSRLKALPEGSPTAQRAWWQKLITNPVAAVGIGAGGGAAMGYDPMYSGMAMLGPYALQKMMMSPAFRNYVMNGSGRSVAPEKFSTVGGMAGAMGGE